MRSSFTALLSVLAALLLLLILLPIIGVISRLPQLDLVRGLLREELIGSLTLSLWTGTFSTVISAVTGVPLAYLMSRSTSSLSDFIRTIMVLPMTIPPLIGGALLLTVYGTASPLGAMARSMGIALTQTPMGIILAQVFVASPFVVLTSSVAFERVDRYYEYSSRVLGKSMMTTFYRVTLPLASRGIIAGLILAWVRALGEFGATIMMAYNPKTVSVQLWEDNAVGGLNLALSGVILVILVSFLSLLFWAWVTRLRREGRDALGG